MEGAGKPQAMSEKLNHMQEDQILLVDGYNVQNNWKEAGFLQPGELDFLRQQMATILSSCAAYWDIQCLLVFDAHHVPGNQGSVETISPNLQVLFSAEGQTADSLIERLAADFAEQDVAVSVCTSDWAEQTIALTRGAARISARELLARVRQAKAEMDRHYTRYPLHWQRSWLEEALPEAARRALRQIRDKK